MERSFIMSSWSFFAAIIIGVNPSFVVYNEGFAPCLRNTFANSRFPVDAA